MMVAGFRGWGPGEVCADGATHLAGPVCVQEASRVLLFIASE